MSGIVQNLKDSKVLLRHSPPTRSGNQGDSEDSFDDSDDQYYTDGSEDLRESTNSLMDIDASDLNQDRWQELHSLTKDVENYRLVFGEELLRIKYVGDCTDGFHECL